jgi:hypothetical protein
VTGKTRAVVAEKVRELERKRDAGTVDASASTGCGPNISTSYTALLDDGYSPASVLRYHRILSRPSPSPSSAGMLLATSPPSSTRPPSGTATSPPLWISVRPALFLEAAGHVCNFGPPDRRPGPRSPPVQGAGAAVEGRRPARRHTHRAAQHPPGPRRRAHLRGAQDPAQPAHAGLPLSLVAALDQHKAAQLGDRMLAGSEWHEWRQERFRSNGWSDYNRQDPSNLRLSIRSTGGVRNRRSNA